MASGSLSRAVRPDLPWRYDGRDRPLFPTPRSRESGNWQRDSKGRKLKRITLTGAAKRWPTPTVHGMEGRHTKYAQGGTPLSAAVQAETPGVLNPTWVEWLMGFPLGWTDLEDSATP